jgi:sigma-E factor negative regulatory protein RseA
MNTENSQVSKTERLSALVDNEADAFETRRLIDELIRSEADRAQWARYHLIGDTLRGGMKQLAPTDFLDRVRQGISEEEPFSVVEPAIARSTWLRPVAGLGVAAAVATVTLLGFQMMATQGHDSGSPVNTAVQVAPVVDPAATEIAETPDPRFARYLENHAELLTPGSSAFARVRNSLDGD